MLVETSSHATRAPPLLRRRCVRLLLLRLDLGRHPAAHRERATSDGAGAARWFLPALLRLLGLLLWKIGSRSAGERRRDILDTLIVTGGVAPAFWMFLVKPLFAVHAPFPALATYVAYPTLVFGLLAMTVRLFFLAGRRTAPHLLLAGWILLELIADVVYLRVSVKAPMSTGSGGRRCGSCRPPASERSRLHLGDRPALRAAHDAPGERLTSAVRAGLLPRGADPPDRFRRARTSARPGGAGPGVAALALVGLLTMRLSGLMVDNTSQVRARQELLRLSDDLNHQALHDPLTGLGNRVLFAERADHALAQRATDRERGTAILLLDLDDFKTVNDTFGHEAGDGCWWRFPAGSNASPGTVRASTGSAATSSPSFCTTRGCPKF